MFIFQSTTITFPKNLQKLKDQALFEFQNKKWIEAEKIFEQLRKKMKAKFQDPECFVLVHLGYCHYQLRSTRSLDHYVEAIECISGAEEKNLALTIDLLMELVRYFLLEPKMRIRQ